MYLSGTFKIELSNVSPSEIITWVRLCVPVRGSCVDVRLDKCVQLHAHPARAEAVLRALRASGSREELQPVCRMKICGASSDLVTTSPFFFL